MSGYCSAAALIEKWRPFADLTRITEGEESETYSFRVGADEYILRINRSASGFEKDAFAHRRFSSGTLPIPEVVDMGNTDDGDAYCISRRLAGVTLQSLSSEELRFVVGPTADVMNTIASSNLDGLSGFGFFDSSGAGGHNSWGDFLTSVTDYDWHAAGQYIEEDQVTRFLVRLTELAGHCPESRCLVHGDFGSNNVLADGGRITGVLDWSEALTGDPLYDVANIFYWRTWLDCMEQQARYFEHEFRRKARFQERLLCYQLHVGLSEIYENAMDGRAAAVRWAVSRCEELMRQEAPA